MKLLPIICIAILADSCNTKTKTSPDTIITHIDTLSLPKDSLAFYFPNNSFSKKPNVDSFVQKWYSSALYSLKEPILSQKFVGHSVYRFLWVGSFHQPVVFTLQQRDGKVWLNTKMLDQQPRFNNEIISGISEDEYDEYFKDGFVVDNERKDMLVRIADRKANIIYNKNSPLSSNEWNEFEQLLKKANYWILPTNIDDGSNDGSEWVIEAHLKNKYHIVSYHSPYNNDYEKAGRFLIKLSGLKVKVY